MSLAVSAALLLLHCGGRGLHRQCIGQHIGHDIGTAATSSTLSAAVHLLHSCCTPVVLCLFSLLHSLFCLSPLLYSRCHRCPPPSAAVYRYRHPTTTPYFVICIVIIVR